MSRKILIGFILLILFLRCFPARELRPPEKIDPDRIIKAIALNEKSIHSSAIQLELKFKGRGKSFSTEAEIFHKEPETFTIYFKSSSHLNIFKSVIKNDSVFFYLPERNEYYLDSYENFSHTEGWEWGIELKGFLNLIIGKNGLTRGDLKFIKREKNQLIFFSEDDLWEKRFWIDYKKSCLIRSEWLSKIDSDFLIRIDYRRYKDYDDKKFSEFMEIKIPSERETLKVRIKKRKINLPLSEKRFVIRIPSAAQRIWLKEKD
jgi:hypothetical protein